MSLVALLLLNSGAEAIHLGVDGETSQTNKAGSSLRLLTLELLTPLLGPCQ
jgi:hypothetical protein